MTVPGFQSFFRPLLEFAADGKEHTVREAREALVKSMNISDEDRAELLPSGTQSRFDNRVAWAKSYFVQAKVLESPRRGRLKITERGRELLGQGHEKIDINVLGQYPELVEFRAHKDKRDKHEQNDQSAGVDVNLNETPEETLQRAYQSVRNDLATDLLSRIQANGPAFFEDLVVDLMVAMGYGGSRADAGRSVGRSGDEGIDGIINEDMLGLDVIYLQAKRWEGSVGRPEIQKFVGALHGKRARKGVFITTSGFSKEAKDYVATIDPKVILIDGRLLVDLMIDHGLGVSLATSYEVKRVDTDYFDEE